jgi:hypothetical protein
LSASTAVAASCSSKIGGARLCHTPPGRRDRRHRA